MSERNVKWTQAQTAAINSLSPDISVTASAGTGKTSVLSSRCVRVLADEINGCDVSQLLVLTYTEAAAGSMASRIRTRLRDTLVESKNSHLRSQLLTLDSAEISTLHAFCKRTISRYFHRLGLDSAFRLIDEDEQKLLASEVLGETIEDAFSDSALSEAMEKLFIGRKIISGKNSFLNTIIEISTFLNTTVSSQNFFDRAMALCDTNAFSLENIKPFLLKKLSIFKSKLKHSIYLDSLLANSYWHDHIASEYLPPIISAMDALASDNFPKCARIINSFSKSRWKPKPKDFDPELKDFIQSPATEALDEFKELADFPYINPEYEKLVAPHLSLHMKTLIELVKRFNIRYDRAKSLLGCLDFSDLEHKMLELLSATDDFETSAPSDVAIALQKQYKYIFIDEYQDINPVQQRIIDLLSTGRNIFVVGDVKQSIYAWRGTDCRLFVERLKRADVNDEVERLDLNENFRSSPAILNFVNAVFSRIMSEPLSPIDYDELAALKPPAGTDTIDSKDIPIEILLLEQNDSEFTDETDSDNEDEGNDENNFDTSPKGSSEAVCLRAGLVARRIKQLVGNDKYQIYDKGIDSQRPIRYDDIVILMRSISNRANDYVQVLRSVGIPVSSASSAGYFETTEINDMLSLLRLLDNCQQDIVLAAVLLGPFFGFTQTQLAKISKSTDGNLHSSVVSYSQNEDNQLLVRKVCDFLATIDNFRTLSRTGSLSDLIWHIYRNTRYLSYVLATPGGSQRRANLLKLHQRAIQFEGFASSSQNISLGRFVDFLERLLTAGGDWAPAEPDGSCQQVVRIMSVHKSKGLEFPVVILAETNSPFSNRFKSGDCITDSKNTVGLKVVDPDSENKFASLSWLMAAESLAETNMAEEMRILYVAMTRACNRLILTGLSNPKKNQHLLTTAALCKPGHLPDWLTRSAKCHLDWIISSLANDSSLAGHFKPLTEIAKTENKLFTLEVADVETVKSFIASVDVRPPHFDFPEFDDKFFSRARTNLSWQYSFGDTPSVRAKDSVSNLSHNDDEFKVVDYTSCFERPDINSLSSSPLIVGSASHLLMQKLDLTLPITIQSIETQKAQLVSSGKIPSAAAKKINTSSIEKFFTSLPGSLALDSENDVYREWPFTITLPATEIHPDKEVPEDEKVIVQGIIDMLIKTDDGIYVIDFKTDRISAEAAMERAGRYESQIGYYCRAAEDILKTKIAAAYLYFLTPAVAVEIK